MLLALVSPIAACNVSTVSTKPNISVIDTSLTGKCFDPVRLPDRELNQAEVERYWGVDRGHLVSCRNKHGRLVKAIEFRDNKLSGKTK